MAFAFALPTPIRLSLPADASRRVLVYTCALALIGAGWFAPAAAASTACLASKAYAASLV